MRKSHLCLVFGFILLLLSWKTVPGGQTQLFDSKRSQQELEIMKGILRTTLDFATKELQGASGEEGHARFDFGGFSNISAFYLYGQGAVFSIPTSSLRHGFNFHWQGLQGSLDGLQGSIAALSSPAYFGALDAQVQDEVARVQEEVERAREEVERAQEEIDRAKERERDANAPAIDPVPAPAAPPTPQAPPAPGQPQAKSKQSRSVAPTSGVSPGRKEQLRKQLAEAQEKVKKRQEELERSRAQFREQLSEIKGYLIEALANHGDSLGVVRPNEYVNLVILEDGEDGLFSNAAGGKREVISVQKSVITDYKAGRITLEAFKQKVLDYSN